MNTTGAEPRLVTIWFRLRALFPLLRPYELPDGSSSADIALVCMFAMTSDTDDELLQRYYARTAQTDGSCEAVLRVASPMVDELEKAQRIYSAAESQTACEPIIAWAGALGIRKIVTYEGEDPYIAWERADEKIALELPRNQALIADNNQDDFHELFEMTLGLGEPVRG